MVPMASSARNKSGINGVRFAVTSLATAGELKGKPRVKWLWLKA
jgi:hypothetical protein